MTYQRKRNFLVSEWITYEQPLNERVRVLMRLEFIFKQITQLIAHDSHLHSRSIIYAIGELLSITERGDLKSEILKELDRHAVTFTKLQQSPGVDADYLNSLIVEVQELSTGIHSFSGQIGAALKSDDFLISVLQRTSIPAGTCDFDLPGYYYWLEQPKQVRDKQVFNWLSQFEVLSNTSRFILDLTRQSSLPQSVTAEAGSFKKSLDKSHPCQIVKVQLPKESKVFPEISGNKQHFSVRFMEYDEEWNKPKQTTNDIDFDLTVCIF